MILGFHGATTMTASLETDIEVASRAGYSGLEIWAEKAVRYLADHSLEALSALFTSRQIRPLALDAIVNIGFRGEAFALVQQQCREWCAMAQAIGCPTIVVVPGAAPSRETGWDEIVREYAAVLADLCRIAQPYGIRLAFEPLGFGWSAVRTPRGAWEIVQKAGCSNLGLVIDAAHFYAGGGQLDELDAIDGSRIFALHLDDVEDLPKEAITDGSRIYPGEGILPLQEICARLKAIGYDGHCSVELFRPEYWEQDPLEVANKARASAIEFLSPYFALD